MNAQQAIEHALEDLIKNNKQFTHYDVTKYSRSFTDDNVSHKDVIAYVSVEMDDKDNYYVSTVHVPKDNVYNSAILYSPTHMSEHAYHYNNIQTDKTLMNKSSVTSPIVKAASAAANKSASIIKKFQQHSTSSGKTYTVFNPNTGHKTYKPQSFSADNSCDSNASCCDSKPDTSVNSSVSSSSKTRQVRIDNRGRICIPKAYLSRIGRFPGDIVYVQKSLRKNKLVISAIQWSSLSHDPLTTNQVDCYGNVRVTNGAISKCNITKHFNGSDEYVTIRSENDHIVVE